MAMALQPRRDWATRTEHSSLRLAPTLWAWAEATSLALEDTRLLALLTHELAQTRGPELTLAYRSVATVSAGFKQMQQQGSHRLAQAPCVAIIVRRKWKLGQSASSPAQYTSSRWPFTLRCLVSHASLLKLQIEGPLWPFAAVVPHGESSATWAGLDSGGNQSSAYVIQAWQLFDARRHRALLTSAQLQAVSF